MEPKALFSTHDVQKFYTHRYQSNYMAEWPREKKDRICEVLRLLKLPDSGIAIDFGCGQGVFTQVIKQALPDWDVYGCDISEAAIAKARSRFSDCDFFALGDSAYNELKCDFIFTHHVFEHVLDLHKAFEQMMPFAQPAAYQLHILPCGNEGSFEQIVSNMTANGIQQKKGNRFFFEDEGHLRRLSIQEMEQLLGKYGYTVRQALYTGHYYGAIKWITEYPKSFVLEFADPDRGNSPQSVQKLRAIRTKLLVINQLRNISRTGLIHLISEVLASLRMLVVLGAKILLFPVAKIVDCYFIFRARQEWERKARDPRGSEMFVLAHRVNENGE